MFESIDYGVVAWCTFALVCGGLIKGALGVGTPLLTVPLMALVLPPQLAVALMSIPIVVANVWQFAQSDRSDAVVGRFWPAFVAVLIGTWIGVKILSVLDERSLLLVVGAVVLLFTALQASSYKFRLSEYAVKPAGAGFGLASGIIGGVSSMFGPMLIIYLLSVGGLSKNQFVSSISFLYVSAVVPWAISLYLFGILDNQLLVYSIIATLPVSVGLLGGRRLRGLISERAFQRLVLVVLVTSGGTMIWRAFN